MRTHVFAALAVSGAVALVTPAAQAAAPDSGDVAVQRVGFGGHRHGNKPEDAPSTRKAEAPHAPPPPETAAQHKAYLNRYGFGL